MTSTDSNLNKYSGEWINWNNPHFDIVGGVSLTLTISGQDLKGSLSSWARNFNFLADADISGPIQNNKGTFHYDDDGRGHSGTVYLTLENDTVQMEIVVDEDSANRDYTFPTGKTILHRMPDDAREV